MSTDPTRPARLRRAQDETQAAARVVDLLRRDVDEKRAAYHEAMAQLCGAHTEHANALVRESRVWADAEMKGAAV